MSGRGEGCIEFLARLHGHNAPVLSSSDSFIRLYLNDYHYAPNAASRLGRFLGHSSEWPTKWTSTERHYLYRLQVEVVLFLLFLLIHLVAASQHPTSNRKGVGRLSSSILHTGKPLSSDMQRKRADIHSLPLKGARMSSLWMASASRPIYNLLNQTYLAY